MAFSSLAILIPFYLISKSEKLIEIFGRGSPLYLRFVTIIIIVWSAVVLAVQGQMTEGPSALFGTVIGYVFASMNKPPESKRVNSEE